MTFLLGSLHALCLLILFAGSTFATTIRAVSVSEMLSRSEFIFEGRVLDRYVHGQEHHPPSIRTCAIFEILDVIKGEPPEGVLELCFSGGSRGQTTRLIHNMVYPVPGETGIYFVASLRNIYVNPLYGWRQGRFLVTTTPGANASMITAGNGRPIVGVRPNATAPGDFLSTGVPHGVLVGGTGPSADKAMAPEAFKDRLREMLRGPR